LGFDDWNGAYSRRASGIECLMEGLRDLLHLFGVYGRHTIHHHEEGKEQGDKISIGD
jgi:hypothetical protein